MLNLTNENMNALQMLQSVRFENNINTLLQQNLPHLYQQSDDQRVRLFVKETFEKAQSKNLIGQQSISQYTALTVIYGRHLEDNPKLPLGKLLKQPILTDEVVNQVYQSATNSLLTNPLMLDNNPLTVDQLIRLPTEQTTLYQSTSQYPIKSGDSLSRIATEHGTTVDAIMQMNPQITDKNKITAGQALSIPNDGGAVTNDDIEALQTMQKELTLISDAPIDQVIQSCQLDQQKQKQSNSDTSNESSEQTTNHFIALEYLYQDNTPVQHAPYSLTLNNDPPIEGVLDNKGQFRLENMPAGHFKVRFGEDYRAYEPLNNTTVNPLFGQITPSYLTEMHHTGNKTTLAEAIKTATDHGASTDSWLWGMLQGDFNANPTTAQIVVGSLISMIPIVDQIMDVRDITANTMILSDGNEGNDTAGWVALSLTAIGLVPILGSALKGALSILMNTAVATADLALDLAFSVLRKLGKGDPGKFLKEINWGNLTKEATTVVREQLDNIKSVLNTVAANKWMGYVVDNKAIAAIKSVIDKLADFEKRIGDGITQGIQGIKDTVENILSSTPKGRIAHGTTDNPITAKTAELELKTIPLPYEIKPDLLAFNHSKIIYKRKHKHGSQEGKYPDSYTKMLDGKPLGATKGELPKINSGLKTSPADTAAHIKEGFPDILVKRDFENFTSLQPQKLPPDTTIYRIIDEATQDATNKSSGSYWAFELPTSKAQWRKTYAVKDSWNDNGHFIEYTVKETDDIKVWVGDTAGQAYKEHGGELFHLEGGGQQIFIAPGLLKGTQIQPQLTNWKDAI